MSGVTSAQEEALAQPLRAFPSRFLKVICERCGRDQVALRNILARMRHEGCGGLPATAELLAGIEGVSSRPVRRIVLRRG